VNGDSHEERMGGGALDRRGFERLICQRRKDLCAEKLKHRGCNPYLKVRLLLSVSEFFVFCLRVVSGESMS
jgi:hypothetical protein